MKQRQTPLEEKYSRSENAPLPVGPGKWVAKVISEVTNPLLVALPTFLIVALATAPDVLHALLWWSIAVLGISLAPLLFIWQGVRRGRYIDHHVSKREQRQVPLFFGLTCMLLVFVLLLFLHASSSLIATVTATLVAVVACITLYWKISLHQVGIAGAVTVYCLVWGSFCLFLSPLVVLIRWARWRLHAHTLFQALAGTILAVGVTILMYYLFGLV
ncbi:hypothetical protein KSC_017920 [Ktedonobacter sp. SOSP1-52]|uniref:hypothetical protein n=1 Tax=Ktedonobacter sp. SOSP1-52 TaxID=2778366 RepID=UPI0019167299|nr:hypothetical protein [Ktedonobacter sp. SOSP1-52]GHO62900.1 hypothetical protein KSC_017920 [Ktedonobacter sp. SOSP1-52]